MCLAFDAAVAAGVPGRFAAWEQDGLLATCASDPALGHLSTVTGVTPDNVAAAVELVQSARWDGVAPTVLVSCVLDDAALRDGGLTRMSDRLLALRDTAAGASDAGPPVVESADAARFVDVLLAGYQVNGTVAAFIRAKHRAPAVRRFLALAAGRPMAAAALTLHDGVAVVGGASTLPDQRGAGAQSALLRHRISVAAQVGCDLIVGTAQPDSVSAANLERLGFRTVRRTAWTRSS